MITFLLFASVFPSGGISAMLMLFVTTILNSVAPILLKNVTNYSHAIDMRWRWKAVMR